MQLAFIVYSNSVDNEMVEIVKKHAGGYTKFVGVHGEGKKEPHLGSHVWPSVNNCIMVAADKKALAEIWKASESLKDVFPGIGVNIMVTGLRKIP